MPRVHKQVARKDIYRVGGRVPDTKTKSGFRRDRSIPNDEHDSIVVKKGQTYYSWSFRYGGNHISITSPKRSQLTQSEYLSQLYNYEDELGELILDTMEELENWINEKKEELEQLRDEQQEKLDNMPEQLQYAPTGELLQQRVESLEEYLSELDSFDTSIDIEDSETFIQEYIEDNFDEEDENFDRDEAENIANDAYHDSIMEKVQDKVDELKEITLNIE